MAVPSTPPDISSVYRLVGERARYLREDRDLTQEDLANRAGVSRASITQFEGGQQRIPLETLYMIAAALNAEITELLPRVHELTWTTQDIFERLKRDSNLDTKGKEALIHFFHAVSGSGKR